MRLCVPFNPNAALRLVHQVITRLAQPVFQRNKITFVSYTDADAISLCLLVGAHDWEKASNSDNKTQDDTQQARQQAFHRVGHGLLLGRFQSITRAAAFALLVFSFLVPGARAQFTLVSGTVTDPNGIPWACGTISATLINNNGISATLNGQIIQGSTAPVKLGCPTDATTSRTAGSFQMQLADNTVIKCPTAVNPGATCGTQTTWQFTVNTTGIAPPQGTGPQSFSNTFTISGSSQTLTFTGVPALSLSGSGGGVGSPATGPVINVTNAAAYPGCFATVQNGQDWSACFASVATAATNASKVSVVGTPNNIRSVVATPMAVSITSATATVNISAGDTVLVGILASGVATLQFTVTDPAGNNYGLVGVNSPLSAATAGPIAIFSTGVGAAKATSGTLTVTCTSGANAFGFIVLDAFNVGSIGQFDIFNVATSTTPANTSPTTTVTQDNNNLVVSFLTYCGGGATTLSANTGTLQTSWNGTAVICGGGLVTNTSASPATLTTSATISASEPWVMATIELRSVQTVVPTVYFPYTPSGYSYASGLNFTLPVNIAGDPGSTLCYTGNAHSIDLGPTNLTSSTFQSTYYTVKGLTFQCGGSMTEGIFINNWLLYVEISDNQFLNFGNSTSAAIWANGNQNDLSVHDNKFLINDGARATGFPGGTGIPRQFVNVTTNSVGVSTLRFEHNSAFCVSGVFGFVGCKSVNGTTLPLLSLAGITHIILGNNVGGGWCPAIGLVNGDDGSKIEQNHFEVDTNGCFAITYQTGVASMKVLDNIFYMSNVPTQSVIGPSSGTQTLQGALIADNSIEGITLNTEIVVAQNNLTGQTGNIARNNICTSAVGGTGVSCPSIHTLGANINQWDADRFGQCTMAAGTCAAFNFSTTFQVAPKCTATWNGSGTLTGILKAASTTSQLTVSSTVNTDTAVVNWACPIEAQ